MLCRLRFKEEKGGSIAEHLEWELKEKSQEGFLWKTLLFYRKWNDLVLFFQARHLHSKNRSEMIETDGIKTSENGVTLAKLKSGIEFRITVNWRAF